MSESPSRGLRLSRLRLRLRCRHHRRLRRHPRLRLLPGKHSGRRRHHQRDKFSRDRRGWGPASIADSNCGRGGHRYGRGFNGSRVFGYKYFFARSDEDQIRALVATFDKDYNNADAAGLMTLVCSQPAGDLSTLKALSALKSLGEAAFAQELRRQVDESGSAATSVANIHVTWRPRHRPADHRMVQVVR